MYKFRKIKHFNKSGFTLVELLLYLALVGIILAALFTFYSLILNSRVKNQAITEVEYQGLQAINTITQVIRNAEDINSPTQGSVASNLSLNVAEINNDPTVFTSSNNTLQMIRASSNPIDLTNSLVNVSNLSFTNLSQTDTPGVIRIELTISHYNPNNKSEYNYEKTFYATTSLRP